MLREQFSGSNPFTEKNSLPPTVGRECLAGLLGPAGKEVMKKVAGRRRLTVDHVPMPEPSLSLSSAEAEALAETEFVQNHGESKEDLRILELARGYLGEQNVHGVEDVEMALGFRINRSRVPRIPYTEADLQKSVELREQGVHEMLVLCVAEDGEGRPMTGGRMNEIFTERYEEMGLGRFLRATKLCEGQPFFTTNSLKYEWRLVTKECLPDTYGKKHSFTENGWWPFESTQEADIKRFALKNGFSLQALHRPEPFEMLYAIAVHLLATERISLGNGELLLGHRAHMTGYTQPFDYHIQVGYVDRDGACIGRISAEGTSMDSGVCLSRDPIAASKTIS